MTKSREEMIRIEYGNLLSKEKGEADDDRSFVNNQQRSNWAHGALPLSAELAGQYFPGHEDIVTITIIFITIIIFVFTIIFVNVIIMS